MNPIARYTRWLHTRWPAGTVERLPEVQPDFSTNVPGVFIVGDLTGVPLLKFSADAGARVVRQIAADPAFQKRDAAAQRDGQPVLDLVIVGAGVSGMAAAIEARQRGLRFVVIEASEPFFTIVNFPKGKPIFTYPTGMTPAGEIQFTERSDIKEGLLDELRELAAKHEVKPRTARVERIKRAGGVLEAVIPDGESVFAHRAIVAIGRSGNFRRLNVPGEDKDKVYNRLHDPKEFCGQNVLVVGGGDSALETAIALGQCGAQVTLSYRKPEFSRPKPENVERLEALTRDPNADVSIEHPSSERQTTATGPFMKAAGQPSGSVRLLLPSKVKAIRDDEVEIETADGALTTMPNDAVFAMIGREPPLDFFRRSGVRIAGEMTARSIALMTLFILFCFWMYHWKGDKQIPFVGYLPNWLNPNPAALWGWVKSLGGTLGAWASDPSTLLGTIAVSSSQRSFWYTLAYSGIVVGFGVARIRRRRTPYVTVQTLVLMAIQVLPLFIIPEILLPWMGANGWFDAGVGAWIKREFFPGGSWWRAYGLILAWPLFVYNWFTSTPMWGWLIIGGIQTFVLVPLIVLRWGKGAYCGWICSCGALAETLGDTFRHKMPHGPGWNRLNMVGQGILLFAFVLMILRVVGWIFPGSWANHAFEQGFEKLPFLHYTWFVDLLLAGVIGYGLYFWYSGRVWCRFACPLAALMHIYARFSQFRILADKKKCISCNVCTSVCHQGIDVMNFANKGLPMNDPECVRCSACVQSCPTGVLTFGRINRKTGETIARDRLVASRVHLAELTINGQARR